MNGDCSLSDSFMHIENDHGHVQREDRSCSMLTLDLARILRAKKWV